MLFAHVVQHWKALGLLHTWYNIGKLWVCQPGSRHLRKSIRELPEIFDPYSATHHVRAYMSVMASDMRHRRYWKIAEESTKHAYGLECLYHYVLVLARENKAPQCGMR